MPAQTGISSLVTNHHPQRPIGLLDAEGTEETATRVEYRLAVASSFASMLG